MQLAFNSRVRIYHAWQNADAHLRRTKQTHEASRAQGRLAPEQLSRSLQLVGEAERRALDAKQEFDHVSRLVKQEAARFEQERVDDFKAALEAFLEGMIDRQKQVRAVVVVFVCCVGCMGLMIFGLQLIGSWETYQQSLLKRITPPSNSSSDGVEVS